MLATGLDGARLARVPARSFWLSVGAVPCPLRPHEAPRPAAYVAAGVHVILYVIFARVGVAITVVSVSVPVPAAMAEVVGAKMATSEDVTVGRLGCDIARVVVRRYYLANLTLAARTVQAMLVVVPLVAAVVTKDNLTAF